MADGSLLKSTSDTLVRTLQTGISGIASTLGLSSVGVALGSPAALVRQSAEDVVNVFLFHIDLNKTLRNSPTVPSGVTGPLNILPVRLSYLITPFALNPDKDPLLIGAVMQVLSEQAVIPLAPDSGSNLRVEFSPLSVADMARLWRSLAVPYHLSITYQVSIA